LNVVGIVSALAIEARHLGAAPAAFALIYVHVVWRERVPTTTVE
jgi:hypothetical protein